MDNLFKAKPGELTCNSCDNYKACVELEKLGGAPHDGSKACKNYYKILGADLAKSDLNSIPKEVMDKIREAIIEEFGKELIPRPEIKGPFSKSQYDIKKEIEYEKQLSYHDYLIKQQLLKDVPLVSSSPVFFNSEDVQKCDEPSPEKCTDE